jgi:hypothetical protein
VDDPAERDALVAVAREANAPGWWHQYADVLPDWYQTYVGLEEAASVLRVYEVQFVPGLLQTASYARAVVTRGRPNASEDEVERRVSMRVTRQELLTKQAGPRLWAIVDEAALRRPVGSPEVFREQLEHLIEVTQDARITLQIAPLGPGGPVAEAGAFTLMRFPDEDLPDVVYLEQLTSALYLDKRETVDHYMAVMERLCLEATPAAATAKIINAILRDG